jgi:hypothetical protein
MFIVGMDVCSRYGCLYILTRKIRVSEYNTNTKCQLLISPASKLYL